jgi:predicted RNase H-like HicB family nuclease
MQRASNGARAIVPARTQEIEMKFRVYIEPDEDGVFVAQVPSLPGCVSQGQTRDEALSNIRQAIELYLESLDAHDDAIPPSIDEELVEVAV